VPITSFLPRIPPPVNAYLKFFRIRSRHLPRLRRNLAAERISCVILHSATTTDSAHVSLLQACEMTTELPLTMSSSMLSISNYHQYQWQLFQQYLGARVLEIGPGFGQYTRRMTEQNREVLACDLDSGHLSALTAAIPSARLTTMQLDLNNCQERRQQIADFRPESILLLNVLEHIEHHEAALNSLCSVSNGGTTLILLVPALNILYNGLDRQAGHFRRYTVRSLKNVCEQAGWQTAQCRYINAVGIPGWIAAGAINSVFSRKEQLDSGSTNFLLRFYDKWFTGLSRLADRFTGPLCGLSVFYVGTAKGH
jgi:2-polyprenyl-3-methyl-5-hydroxy-6-metoxy-1,4-benzoquinol methylase